MEDVSLAPPAEKHLTAPIVFCAGFSYLGALTSQIKSTTTVLQQREHHAESTMLICRLQEQLPMTTCTLIKLSM
jgi:hypothetical protein